jgi:hypothetical protein
MTYEEFLDVDYFMKQSKYLSKKEFTKYIKEREKFAKEIVNKKTISIFTL